MHMQHRQRMLGRKRGGGKEKEERVVNVTMVQRLRGAQKKSWIDQILPGGEAAAPG